MAEPLEREIEGLRALFRSDRDPEGRAFVPLADAYRRSQDLKGAIQLLHEGLERHPNLASAWVVAAWTHRDRGDRATARAAWRRVLELDEENVEALRGLATLLLEGGHVDEARPYLEKVRSLNPDDPDVRGELATLDVQRPVEPPAEAAATTPSGVQAESPPREPEAEPSDASRLYDEITIERIVALAEAATAGANAEAPAEAPSTAGELPAPPAEAPPFEPVTASEEAAILRVLDSLAESAAPSAEVLAPHDDRAAPAREEPTPQAPVVESTVAEDSPPVELAGPESPPADEPLVLAAGAELLFADGEIMEVWGDAATEEEDLAVDLPATRTLAELYARQGLIERAAEIYERLADENPLELEIHGRLEELRTLLRPRTPSAPSPPASAPAPSSPAHSVHADDTERIAAHFGGSGAHHETVASPFWAPADEVDEEVAYGGEPISGYFRRLLEWSSAAEGGVAAEESASEPEAPAPESHFGGLAGLALDADAPAEAYAAPEQGLTADVDVPPEVELSALAAAAALASAELAPPAFDVAPAEAAPPEAPAPELTPSEAAAAELAPPELHLATEDAAPPEAEPEADAATRVFDVGVAPEASASPAAEPEALEAAPPTAVVAVESLAPDVVVPKEAFAPSEVVPIESLAPGSVVPIESLAPGRIVPIESLAPSNIVPIASLAPDAVPIESLAPDAAPSHDGSTILF